MHLSRFSSSRRRFAGMAAAAVLVGAIGTGAAVTGSASAADNPQPKKNVGENTHLLAVQKAPWVNSFRVSLLNGNVTPNTPEYCFTGWELNTRVAGDFVPTTLEIKSAVPLRSWRPQVPPSKVQWFTAANCTGTALSHNMFRAYDDANVFWYVRMGGPDLKPGP